MNMTRWKPISMFCACLALGACGEALSGLPEVEDADDEQLIAELKLSDAAEAAAVDAAIERDVAPHSSSKKYVGYGEVYVIRHETASGSSHLKNHIGAYFFKLSEPTSIEEPTEKCQRERIGRCVFEACQVTNPSGPQPAVTPVPAGRITIRSNRRELVLTPDAKSQEYQLNSPHDLFPAGTRVTIVAEGQAGGAPQHRIHGRTSPAVSHVTNIDLPSPSEPPYVLDRKGDLALKWAGSVTKVGGVVRASVSKFTPVTKGYTHTAAKCYFNGTAKQGVMPSKVLAKLNAGVGYTLDVLVPVDRYFREFEVDDWYLVANFSAGWQVGDASGAVELR